MKHLYTLTFLLLFTTISFSQQYANFPPHRAGNDFKSYISKDSINFEIGQKLEIGLPYSGNLYTFITQGTEPTAPHIAGSIVSIHKLKSIGNPRTGFKMYAIIKGFGLAPVNIDLENALKVEEILIIE